MDKATNGKLLVVDCTGKEKSLILYMTALSTARITLVIMPLLSLTENQLLQIQKAVQKYGSVYTYNLGD